MDNEAPANRAPRSINKLLQKGEEVALYCRMHVIRETIKNQSCEGQSTHSLHTFADIKKIIKIFTPKTYLLSFKPVLLGPFTD